jgi:hypothetical protein
MTTDFETSFAKVATPCCSKISVCRALRLQAGSAAALVRWSRPRSLHWTNKNAKQSAGARSLSSPICAGLMMNKPRAVERARYRCVGSQGANRGASNSGDTPSSNARARRISSPCSVRSCVGTGSSLRWQSAGRVEGSAGGLRIA